MVFHPLSSSCFYLCYVIYNNIPCIELKYFCVLLNMDVMSDIAGYDSFVEVYCLIKVEMSGCSLLDVAVGRVLCDRCLGT